VQAFDLKSEESSNDNTSLAAPHVHSINKGWDTEAHLVPPNLGSCGICVKAQHPTLQAVIKAAICEVTGDALFVTAFPSVITTTSYFHDTLSTLAKNLNFPTLCRHFEEDPKFTEVISHVVSCLILVLLPYISLIFDHSWLAIFHTSVVALNDGLYWR
jgi:hypothetical protein